MHLSAPELQSQSLPLFSNSFSFLSSSLLPGSAFLKPALVPRAGERGDAEGIASRGSERRRAFSAADALHSRSNAAPASGDTTPRGQRSVDLAPVRTPSPLLTISLPFCCRLSLALCRSACCPVGLPLLCCQYAPRTIVGTHVCFLQSASPIFLSSARFSCFRWPSLLLPVAILAYMSPWSLDAHLRLSVFCLCCPAFVGFFLSPASLVGA